MPVCRRESNDGEKSEPGDRAEREDPKRRESKVLSTGARATGPGDSTQKKQYERNTNYVLYR